MEQLIQDVIHFVRDNHIWGPPVAGFLAFCESLAIISLFVPATTILIALGVLIAASGVPIIPFIAAGAIGAALGDWLSYWFGARYGSAVKTMWPFAKRPEMFERGEAFFKRWGPSGVFIGRFFGPLRAIVPLLAGMAHMRPLYFQIANWASAILWAALLVGGPSLGFSAFK